MRDARAIGSGARVPPVLVEGGGDDAHTAVCCLDDAPGERHRARELGGDLVGVDGERIGVDDQAVDQMGGLVQDVGEHTAGDDQPGATRGVLDPLGDFGELERGEQVGVVEQHGLVAPARAHRSARARRGAAGRQGRPPVGRATTCRTPEVPPAGRPRARPGR